MRETHDRLKKIPLNFVGNVEGREVFAGNVEVIVSDGFIGNIALKISEGAAQQIGTMLKKALKATIGDATWLDAGAQCVPAIEKAD